MAIDDEAFLRRRPSLSATEIVRRARTLQPLPASEIARWCAIRGTRDEELEELDEPERWERYEAAVAAGTLRWRADCPQEARDRLTSAGTLDAILPRQGRLREAAGRDRGGRTLRPDLEGGERTPRHHCQQLSRSRRAARHPALGPSARVSATASAEPARSPSRPRVSAATSMPRTSTRSAACSPGVRSTSWVAMHAYARASTRRSDVIADAVDEEITELGIEHDEQGNRAKAYLWCLETRCPRTGWLVPMATSWVISRNYRVVRGSFPIGRKPAFRDRDRHGSER